ncbi:hypothetical protein CE457_11895 [Vreelandella boliviensis LC1]|nr:hypothetical protein CE457_11895 [Halomonas boliviensis LC1]
MFIKHLEKHTDAFYLCALGDDKTWVSSCLRGSFKYSPLNRLTFKNFYRYYYSLKYVVSPAYAYLDRYAVKKAKAIIAGLDDYFLAYKDLPNVRLIRLPISRDHFVQPKYKDLEKEPLVIFHAWQKGKELKKGNDILHEAALSAVRKYGEKKIKYVIASGLPYEEYLKAYNDCDIYLDQVYSYDGGVTAALGMAAGKVVFSGYELFAEYSGKAPNSIKNVGVNASSNLAQLEESLFYIIENTHVLDDLKHKAYFYALNNYESIMIAEKYIDVWTEGEK